MPVFEHYFLVKAESFEEATHRVTRFIERYELLSYDTLEFFPEDSFPATHPRFYEILARVEEKNRKTVREFLSELAREGYGRFENLAEIPQGYLSKLFHTIAHLLDGFMGIDSHFYNLVEDSHWVSPALRKKLQESPHDFWLIRLLGHTEISEPRFELLNPERLLKV
ncbi:MAG TPA: hypothetical protein ENJ40_05590 [Thermosulfurimonas dismutans]|uniref:Uncharacterized protein n=1 Tax=Thermosulfurimonas dismutans TaxID=999894 RepID=A0A7C3CLI0_9BACT|nr:hypothetical protein [Thermosulfurimonas dismutans]